MFEEHESFDPAPFITMLDNFGKVDLMEVLRTHKWPQGDQKVATLKSKATALLKDPAKGQDASATVLYYKQNILCPFSVKKINEEETKQQIIGIAQRITDELDIENVTAKYDDQGLMFAPYRDCKQYFDKGFLTACNNKLNAIQLISASGIGWNGIDKESQQKWRNYRLKLVKLYDEYLCDGQETAVVEKKEFDGGIKIESKCHFCFNKKTKPTQQYQHMRNVHFPEWQTKPQVKSQCEAAITSMKNDPFAVEFHAKILSIWQSLWSDQMSSEHVKLIKKAERLFKDLMKGDKNTVVYILAQLCNGYESVKNCDLPATIFRYVGKKSNNEKVRHFEPTSRTGGTVACEITKLIQKHLSHNNSEIQQSDRLFGWYAVKCPVKSLEVLEMSVIMAMWHLTGNDSQKYWNMQLNAIPEHKSFRNHNPEELVILGLYALKQIVDEFNKQTQLGEKPFFKSSELLSIYDAFNEQDRASFNARYKITENVVAQNTALKDIVAKYQDRLRVAAERWGDTDLLEDCRRLEAMTLEALGTQTENVGESSDIEMVDDE